VLVSEDNADAAESLRDVLALLGQVVEVARDGSEGLSTARRFRPEAVLCDIGLPGIDGYAVTRAIRADRELRGAFLVALTGYAMPEDQARAAEAASTNTWPSLPISGRSRACSPAWMAVRTRAAPRGQQRATSRGG